MGDYAGSYEHTGDEEVKHVVHEDWSWMHNTGTDDAGALNEGRNSYEEEEYDNEEDEYDYDTRQQVAVEGGSKPIRSASTGHQVVLVEDASESSQSSHDDKPKLEPETKKTKGARRQFKHLQEHPLNASSDPGYGGSSESFQPEDARSMSINLVTSWLQDAALEEHPKDRMHAQHGSIPPQRRPPPRRPPPPGADMGAHTSRRSSSLPGPVPQYEYEAQDCGKTPAWDPSGSHARGYEEDHRVALYDASGDKPSFYRLEPKPLDKALKFMRTGAVGFAQASKTAAIGFGKASRGAAVVVHRRTMEMTNLAVPVFTPIIQAVLEESKGQLMGSDQDRDRAAQVASMGGGPGSGPGGGRGRGRGPIGPPMMRPMQPGMLAGPRPGMRPVMGPGMPGGPRPGMRPVMGPGMPDGPRPGMRPVMGPGMPGGPRPGMRPVMGPGMPGGPRPGMRPVMGPGMPGGPRPGMRPVMGSVMPGGPRPGMRPVMGPGMPAGPRPGMRPVMRPGMLAGPGPGMRPVMRPGWRPGMAPDQGPGQFQPVPPPTN